MKKKTKPAKKSPTKKSTAKKPRAKKALPPPAPTVPTYHVNQILANNDVGTYHILYYVFDCERHIAKFETMEALNAFIFQFTMDHYDNEDSGTWLDFVITNVSGDVLLLDERDIGPSENEDPENTSL